MVLFLVGSLTSRCGEDWRSSLIVHFLQKPVIASQCEERYKSAMQNCRAARSGVIFLS